jgi:hypothetical protein
MRVQTWLAAVALAGVAVSCGPKNSSSDQSIATDIQSKLAADATTKPSAVNVAVKDGVVTLTGDVPGPDVELEAMKVANATAGVRSVNDQLKVNTALATPPPAASAPAGANQPPNTSNAMRPSTPPPSDTAPPPGPAASAPPPTEAAPPAQQAATPPPRPAPPPKPVFVTVPAGERLSVRMIDGIDTKVNTSGQTFRASLDSPLVVGSRVVVPAGTPVTVLLENAKGAGRIKGASEASIRATRLQYSGRTYEVNTSIVEQQGKGRGKQTAVRTGIGAAAGALIGGLAGGGKGAGIGAAVGGGAGFGLNAFTHGEQVKIPSETVLNFQLQAPLRIEKGKHAPAADQER